MTWIKTIPFSEADGKLREAVERQRALYPSEYGAPTTILADDERGGIVERRCALRAGPAPAGAPAIGSAGCGLDRSPGPVLALRSRGVSLLPPFGRETTHAASYWELVGQEVQLQHSIAGTRSFPRLR